MYMSDGSLRLSATGLAKHLGCRHLTELAHQVALGTLEASTWHDPALALLQKRGLGVIPVTRSRPGRPKPTEPVWGLGAAEALHPEGRSPCGTNLPESPGVHFCVPW